MIEAKFTHTADDYFHLNKRILFTPKLFLLLTFTGFVLIILLALPDLFLIGGSNGSVVPLIIILVINLILCMLIAAVICLLGLLVTFVAIKRMGKQLNHEITYKFSEKFITMNTKGVKSEYLWSVVKTIMEDKKGFYFKFIYASPWFMIPKRAIGDLTHFRKLLSKVNVIK